MIAFLIFYFILTGFIAMGIVIYNNDGEISFTDLIVAFVFGFVFIPLGIGALMAKIMSDDIIVKIEKEDEYSKN